MDQGWTPPAQIEEFRVERRLGRGGMGDVWLARDTLLDRDVALKFATAAASDEARLRFRVEARAVARLQHPNILAVHHAGELADRPFLVTELLRGQSLDRVGRIDAGRVVAIGADLSRALAAAHAAGVIHRDVKPANAFLCEDGAAKLLDFGLAQLGEDSAVSALAKTLTETNNASKTHGALGSTQAPAGRDEAVGTPLYMAPETWRGEGAARSTDVYSLGTLMFTLLANRPPFGGNTLLELRTSVLAGLPPDLAAAVPEAPAALVALVLRCMSLRPEARPSAVEVCNALQAMLDAGRAVSKDEGDPDASPYRGLLSFGSEHRGIFFGREAETAAVLTELRGAPFVLVVGPSGAGKSSLVRAGVLPLVLAGALGRHSWRVATMVPGARPIERMTQALSTVLDAPEQVIAAGLSASSVWAAQGLAEKGEHVLLFVDQFEEAWTLSGAPERAALLEALGALARVGTRVRIVATLRADFLSKVKDLGELRTEALRAPVVLGPLSSEGLRRAIAQPALRRGVEVVPELVDRLVETARGASGMLPLLEFALGVLWERRDRAAGRIAVADLDAMGGLEGALASHADATLARLAPRLRTEARRLLLELVTVDCTRARREERELIAGSPDARTALDALIDARLVAASAGEETTAYEVAHEVLLTGWPALRGWLDEESAAREALERVRRAAAEWERLGHSVEALFGERQLEELSVLEGRVLPSETAAYVAESRAAVRRQRRRRLALAVGVPLALAAGGMATWTASAMRHHAAVAHAIAAARALDEKAEEVASAAATSRAEAFALFERDDLGPAEARWKKTLALEGDADRERRDVGAALDLALALDPRDPGARSLYADVTLARLLAAERLHEASLLGALRAQLDVYDDGSRAAQLRAPAHVKVETEPPAAKLTLARYREDSAGRLVERDTAPLAAEGRREIEPGSYLLVAEAPGRYATRYPFLARRGEDLTLRVVLPRAADVPERMIYVPGGRTLYGSADDEAARIYLEHQPMHDVEVGAFLIARTEVTNGAYLAFLAALPEAERKARLPVGLALMNDGHIAWKLREKTLAPGEPYCSGVEPCVDWSRVPVDGASLEDGERYAAWLSQSGRLPGARLCTDREWERAARGADDRRYPGGNGDPGPADACTLATYGGDVRRAGPCTPGTHPSSRSPFGADDMAGSAFEWTPDAPDAARSHKGILRGGSYLFRGLMDNSLPNRATNGTGRRAAWGLRICATTN